MIKRFGISGMSMFGMLALAAACDAMQEDGGEGAAASTEAAPAAAAPAAKPATVAVEAPAAKPEPAVNKDDPLTKAGFAPAEGDPGLTYAMTFLANNGFTADHPAVDAAFAGDFSLLKAELATKALPGWEQALGLAEQSYGRHVEQGKATQEAVGKVVTDFAAEAGVDWEAAVAHVGSSASAQEKTAINQLLADPATARIAAMFITNTYANADGVEVMPQAQATNGNTTVTNTAAGPLTRQQYTKAMGELRKQIGDGYVESPQAQALYARLQR